MKRPIRRTVTVLVTTALVGSGALALAAEKSATTSTASASQSEDAKGPNRAERRAHGRHLAGAKMHERGMMGRIPSPFMHVVRKLDLSAEQRQKIDALLQEERDKRQAGFEQQREQRRATLEALANPGDPNYITAVNTAKAQAADAVQARSDLEIKVYKLLTSAQQAQVPSLLAEQRAHRDEMRGGQEPGNRPRQR